MDGVGKERKAVSFGMWLGGCYCVLLELLNHTTCFPSLVCSVIRKIKSQSLGLLQPHKTFGSRTPHQAPSEQGLAAPPTATSVSGTEGKTIVDTTDGLETARRHDMTSLSHSHKA